MDQEKICIVCGQTKPLRSFHGQKSSDGSFKRGKVCNQCRKDRELKLRDPLHLRGELAPNWKGNAAKKHAGRWRARHQFQLSACERCGAPATDRHHKDTNTLNNDPSNIEILCRRCHMQVDGRLDAFVKAGEGGRRVKPIRPCHNCGRLQKYLRKGRCDSCDWYFRSRGVEKPQESKGNG